MDVVVATPVETLPLKELFSEVVFNFLEKTKSGDTFASNDWAKGIRDRIKRVLGDLAAQYGYALSPLGGVGKIRRNNQYLNFRKLPMRTNRGFYPIVGFRFDTQRVEYAFGYSNDNPVPDSFVETMRSVGEEALPDFSDRTAQGLPMRIFDLAQTTDQELTQTLIALLDAYQKCLDELTEELAAFEKEGRQKLTNETLTPEELEELLDNYVAWCSANPDNEHLLQERPGEYNAWSREYFSSIPADRLASELIEFVADGGKLQSGGERSKSKFARAVSGREEELRAHILKAYEAGFDLEQWWEDCASFNGFGKGIRSIFLHRVFPDTYAPFNDKALAGYQLLGAMPTRGKRWSPAYSDVNTAAHSIRDKRPEQLSLYRADHLTHYIKTPEGERIVQEILRRRPQSAANSPSFRIWVLAGGRGGSAIDAFTENNVVAIDFGIRESLMPCTSPEKIDAAIRRAHTEPGEHPFWVATCFAFSQKMRPGDVVVLRNGLRGIGAVGVVSSRYGFDKTKDRFPHTRHVSWVRSAEWQLDESDQAFWQSTLGEIAEDPERLAAVKRATGWSDFEAELTQAQDEVRLASPFQELFCDGEEAHAAFDLLARTLRTLKILDPRSERLALTLPGNGVRITLNYGARTLLGFRREEGELQTVFCAKRSELGVEEKFEWGEFSVDTVPAGVGLKQAPLSEFLSSQTAQEHFDRAVEAIRDSYSQRAPYARMHIPALVSAALDPAARERLFLDGLSHFESGEQFQDFVSAKGTEEEKVKGRNVIYFGPPGTGKTWTLLNEERKKFVVEAQSSGSEERLRALVADEPWWVVLAAALCKMGPSKVPDIAEHPLVQARHSVSSAKRLRSTIWSSLQMHTTLASETVSYTSRQEPLIFDKSPDSTWSVKAEMLAADAPEVLQLAEAASQDAQSSGTISRCETVTFHQSFSYEDFIEGIKPRVSGDGSDSLGYEIQPGIFKRLCDRARADKEHEYAIFIDEINRGNVASIFGELISLIEADKREGAPREISVRLPYSKELFSVPANVSILGTMNSADRSVEALDTALRRRFTFEEISPSVEVLRQAGIRVEGVDVPRLFEVVNERLERLLNRDHQIGHAYFLELSESRDSLEALRLLFRSKIIPLMQEYFYADMGRIGLVLGSAFVERVERADLADFNYPDADLLREREIYRLRDPMKLSAADFRSVYGG